jgi:TonB family protein
MATASAVAPTPALGQGAAPVEQAHKPKLTRPPELLKFVEAAYPDSEKAAGRSATVVLQIAISAAGVVDDVKVVESAGVAFDAAAVTAVKSFVFRPAELDNQPAPIRILYRYQFVLKAEAPTVGSMAGTVRDRATKAPLAGVTVAIEGQPEVVTDGDGRFLVENVPPGSHAIVLSRTDLKAMQTAEAFEAGKRLEAVYEVEQQPPPSAAASDEDADDLEIVVTAPKLTKQVVSTIVEADQGRKVAGTQGDVLKVVENMPGVSRATAGSGAIVVWGAAPQDTRVYVDGVRVPQLYHFGGLRSVIHTDLVRSVELVPGGYGAAYGRGLGGLITVDKRAPAADKVHGSVGVDFLDASASAQGPLTDKLRFQAAVRKSHLDWVLDKATSEDVGAFFPVPKYHDAQASLRYQLGEREWVEVGGLLSSDSVSRNVSSVDPGQRKRQTQDLTFDRLFVRYQKLPGDGSEISIVPWVGRDHSSLTYDFGGTPTSLGVRSMNYGLRASYSGIVTSFLHGSVGLDLEATSSTARRRGSITSPPREGDARLFGQPPSDQINDDEWSAVVGSVAPYAEGDFSLLSDRVHIVPGIRVEPYLTSVDRRLPRYLDGPTTGAYVGEVAVQPRLAVRYSPVNRVTFKAAFGRYRQPPLIDDLSPVFGNPLLVPATATHLLGGVSVKIGELFGIDTTAFYSKSDDLPVRNPVTAPSAAEALINGGQGRSFGAQFLLRRELSKGLFGWVAYTLLRSERLDAPGQSWRLFDFDQTHVLTALASYDLGKGFEVGARFRYATGFPRTPVLGAFYDSRRNLYDPILGDRNTERIPAFYQLDVRFAKRFKIGKTELEAYADVQNVTDRQNPEEIIYSADYATKRYIRGLPILPIVGAKWSF